MKPTEKFAKVYKIYHTCTDEEKRDNLLFLLIKLFEKNIVREKKRLNTIVRQKKREKIVDQHIYKQIMFAIWAFEKKDIDPNFFYKYMSKATRQIIESVFEKSPFVIEKTVHYIG